MIPREKAAQLVVNYQIKVRSLDYKEAVQCALVAVDEIIAKHYDDWDAHSEYWMEVKQEIEKL